MRVRNLMEIWEVKRQTLQNKSRGTCSYIQYLCISHRTCYLMSCLCSGSSIVVNAYMVVFIHLPNHGLTPCILSEINKRRTTSSFRVPFCPF